MFKIGDKVKILSHGKEGTLTGIDSIGYHYVKGEGYIHVCNKADIELVKETFMFKFSEGDKVKSQIHNKVGTVTNTGRFNVQVKFEDGSIGICDSSNLELILELEFDIPDMPKGSYCCCSSRDLFNFGCRCGFIEPYEKRKER